MEGIQLLEEVISEDLRILGLDKVVCEEVFSHKIQLETLEDLEYFFF
jgi:hypothetical protein